MSSDATPKTRRRSSVHEHVKHASKMLDNWSKGISKGITAGVTKSKGITAKIFKVEPTKESDEITSAFAQLNELKTTIDSLSDGTIVNLHNAQSNASIFNLKLSETFMSLHGHADEQPNVDLFRQFLCHCMGRKLFKLSTMTNEYLIKMNQSLVRPIDILKTKELKKAYQNAKNYKNTKYDFDFAVHKYQKLNGAKKQNMKKINTAEHKKNEKFKKLEQSRKEIIACVNNLENKKQIDLLNCIDTFWQSYLIFAHRQAQIVQLKDKFDQEFEELKAQIFTDQDDIKSMSPTPSIYDDDLLNKSTSLRIAESMSANPNNAIPKELRYKNPIKLGSGAFATVYKANDVLQEEQAVAIKKICIGDGKSALYLSSTKQEAENELQILKKLKNHANIVQLLDHYYENTVYNDQYLNVVMEFVPKTLRDEFNFYGESGDAIPHSLIQLYSFQLIRAVNYLHIHAIAHRDIKPRNLLIDAGTQTLKLCDFGCSVQLTHRYHGNGNDDDDDDEIGDALLESYVCSRYYRAPELILQSGYYDCKCDIWSIGTVISEMFLGTLLFEGYNDEKEQLDDIVNKLGTPTESDIEDMNSDYIDKQTLLDTDCAGESWEMLFCAVMDMPQDAIDLMAKILVYSPRKRLSAIECLTQAYFGSLSKNEKYKHLFDWNEMEIMYAKASRIML